MIHSLSPLIYMGYVEIIRYIIPCPNSELMKYFRKIYNLFMSILSLFMFFGIIIANYQMNKFDSLDCLLCSSYENNFIANISTKLFLYSKYLEWLDTLFLQLSGKYISNLQYTHHMSTAFLTYHNISEFISPHIFIFMSINCLVHVFMYLYYAYPNSILKKYRKLITQSQIIQHILCLLTIIYVHVRNDCPQNGYGNEMGLLLYSMYLFYFVKFYISQYIKSINNKRT